MGTTQSTPEKKYETKHAAFAVVVFHYNKGTKTSVLVVLNDEGKWMIPGGYVNRGENLKSAAKRELKEETGFIVKETDLTFLNQSHHSRLTVSEYITTQSIKLPQRMRKRIFDERTTPKETNNNWAKKLPLRACIPNKMIAVVTMLSICN